MPHSPDPVRTLGATLEGDGPRTVVFANGFCTTPRAWDVVRSALPPGWRVLRFQYVGDPGTDESGWAARRYETLHGHADDLVALLTHLDVRDAVLVGHSMGAMVGALAQVAAPERIGRLVMLAASPRYVDVPGEYVGGFSRATIDDLLAQADADLAAWMGGFAPVMFGEGAPARLLGEFVGQLTRMRPDVARLTLRSTFAADYRDVLPRVSCPVTVLQPERDVAVPVVVGQYLARVLPHATLRVLDVTGHLPHLTDPAPVAGALRAVLEEASRARPATDRAAATR